MNTAVLVITMAVKNASKTLDRSILSFLSQKEINDRAILIISDDHSTDDSVEIIEKYLISNQIILIKNEFNSVSENRNFLIDYTIKNFSNCYLIGRLDADDILASDTILYEIEKLWYQQKFDAIVLSNTHYYCGEKLQSSNIATEDLLDEMLLYHRIKSMANQCFKDELPSCNLLISPKINDRYPLVESAEDHWLLVFILMQKHHLKIAISQMLYCGYSINGSETQNNIKKNKYIQSRLNLLLFYTHFLNSKGYL